jgi:hypothetical protein
MISEKQALEALGMTEDDLVQPNDLVEKIFFLKHHFFSMHRFHGPDAHKEFAEWIGVDRVISVRTAREVMDAVSCVYGSIAIQKWCVAFCFAPWLLKGDGRFGIGLCYFSLLSGYAPTKIGHVDTFVHKKPAFDYYPPNKDDTSQMQGGAAI